MGEIVSKKLVIKGMVQGVGFRPFIFNLANSFSLKGSVLNTSFGVLIHIEGRAGDVESFCNLIPVKCPSIAFITDISIQNILPEKFNKFSILVSSTKSNKAGLVLPDISVCDRCVLEMLDPLNRRYQYPFINCTECGPRYSIIEDLPYDRKKTSMKQFEMCDACTSEYTDYKNRRFHAQPNACKNCGPGIFLLDRNKNLIKTKDPAGTTAELLKKGYIVAIKGVGGFHLSVDAENDHAVKLLRKRKKRPEKPFALMSYSINHIRQFAQAGEKEEKALYSMQRPIVLLEKKPLSSVSDAVAPETSFTGVMLPCAPLHYLILKDNFLALVMTSGNISGEPIIAENEEAFEKLHNIADYFLINNRNIIHRSDDSVIKHILGIFSFIRRSRGYVPAPVFLKKNSLQVLACGGDLKSVICITKKKEAFLSRHIGNIENPEAFKLYVETVNHMKSIFNINPEIIAHDLHPDYLSSKFAKKYKNENPGICRIPVQHHHAHIAACMAENMVDSPVIGIALDGTGYGTDGCIWGGEVLIAETERFKRAAHLSYIPMPGAAAAIKEPWRMGISYLHHALGKNFYNSGIPFLQKADKKKVQILINMISAKINSPLTSGMGRLFDAVAAIIGIKENTTYQGQAAIKLESISVSLSKKTYRYNLNNNEIVSIDVLPVIRGIVDDLKKGADLSLIGKKFHNTLIKIFTDLCKTINKETSIKTVALSGGVFSNKILHQGLVESLKSCGFNVITHKLVPANDGGLALGQAVVASSMMQKQKVFT